MARAPQNLDQFKGGMNWQDTPAGSPRQELPVGCRGPPRSTPGGPLDRSVGKGGDNKSETCDFEHIYKPHR